MALKKLFLGVIMFFLVSASPGYQLFYEKAYPPEQFQAYGSTTITIVNKNEIPKYCNATLEKNVIACTKFSILGNTMIVPDPCPGASEDPYALIMCHEAAHAIGGWSSKHESSR